MLHACMSEQSVRFIHRKNENCPLFRVARDKIAVVLWANIVR